MARQIKTVPDRKTDTHFWVDLVSHPEKNVSNYSSFEDALDQYNRFELVGNFSFVNAWWLAEASFLAYCLDDEKVKKIYHDKAGLECIPLSHGSTQCHLAFNDQFAIVAFRGTQSDQWDDIFHDAEFVLEDWPEKQPIGCVHQGFKNSLAEIQEPLQEAIRLVPKDCPFWVTGHSLGAALAVLTAHAMHNDPNNDHTIGGIYTFGCPRVGNQDFVQDFKRCLGDRSFRYVNDHDVVTHVPPEPCGLSKGSYGHVEAQRWIDQNGVISTAAPTLGHYVTDVFGGSVFLYDAMQFLMAGLHKSMPDLLKDHAPVLYAIHTWNDLVKNLP